MSIDAVTLGVMASRVDGITREMTHTMVRTARSTTMAARDFSCSLTTSEHDLLSCPEGMPVHVFGSTLIARSMQELHPEFRDGDAFLHNDPYLGNSHAADHTILVPVFFEGEHVFTACAKAHQADCGNAQPTTYSPTARDVYEEGALIFPCVLVQRDYSDQIDIIRMCERRIRAFDTWYGDYLATLGAARLAERRLKEFCADFGLPAVREFFAEWLDYSERMAAAAIGRLPAGSIVAETTLDPFPGLPDGIPLRATVKVDPVAMRVSVDLRENPDCTPTGLNLTESTARNSATTAVLMALNSERDAKEVLVPNNSGAYRRIEVLVRENCVVGIPRHPASASVATNTVTDRTVGMIMCALAQMGESAGTGEPCYGSPPFEGVVSGKDPLRGGAPYVFQIFCGTSGGPALSGLDGWLAFHKTGDAGLGYIDSSEVVEQKYPLVIWEKVVRIDSEGAGRWRGAPGCTSIFGPRLETMQSQYFLDGAVNRPRGVRGGDKPLGPEAWLVRDDGTWEQRCETVGAVAVEPGECIVSLSCGGGGYGRPLQRDPAAVRDDVVDGYLTAGRARAAYGVVLRGDSARWETLAVDEVATAELRARIDCDPPSADAGRCGRDEPRWWIA
jgi:N-methylhydantoinase B